MNVHVAVLLVLAVASHTTLATVYTRCGLVNALKASGLTTNLANWVCLIESESSRNTAAKGGPNSNGSYDYGLFQINDGYWCGTSAAGGDCSIKCSQLLDNSITDDVNCAKIIYARHGFNAWYGWKNKCQGTLPDISSC